MSNTNNSNSPKRMRFARNGAMVDKFNVSRTDMWAGHHSFEWGDTKLVLKGSDHNRIFDKEGYDLYEHKIGDKTIFTEFTLEELNNIGEY